MQVETQCLTVEQMLTRLGLCRALDKHLVQCCMARYQQHIAAERSTGQRADVQRGDVQRGDVQRIGAQHDDTILAGAVCDDVLADDREWQDLQGWLLLASGQLAQGHVCLDIDAALATPHSVLPSGQAPYGAVYQQFRRWLSRFRVETVLALCQRHPVLIGDNAPFVLRSSRLYLRRYAMLEQRIAEFIRTRLQAPRQPDVAALRSAIDAWFGPVPARLDWQRQACALAATRDFAVITGGPGTGKTTTVVRLVGVLCQLASPSSLQIALAAPTGKAAARLSESIEQAVLKLPAAQQQLLARVPRRALTLHRLLQRRADGQFFYNAGQPLPVDVLIIDEASMVDVELLASVMQAMPRHARLILLGDKDQLASVEAGAVLAELCDKAELAQYTHATRDLLEGLTGQVIPSPQTPGSALQQAVVMLRESRRFAADSGIGQLARWVNQGDRQAVQQWCSDPTQLHDDVQLFKSASVKELWPMVRTLLRPLWQQQRALQTMQLSDEQAAALALPLLSLQSQLQLLCAVRQGPWGVVTMNQQLQNYLRGVGDIQSSADWYSGRPVIIMENDYSTALMNGDVGLCIGYLSETGEPVLKVAFADGQGGVRLFLPSRLPQLETAFALTVHKSQGSEYQHAMLLLPEHDSPVLTRELIYTAITRAKQQFSLVLCDPMILLQAIDRPTERRGGLRY